MHLDVWFNRHNHICITKHICLCQELSTVSGLDFGYGLLHRKTKTVHLQQMIKGPMSVTVSISRLRICVHVDPHI